MEGQVWTSMDDGNEWQSHPIETEEAPQAITCDSENGLWVVGSFSSILSSNDAGKTWALNSLDEDTIFTSIQFLDANNAVISGEFGTLLKSRDGGETWESMPVLKDEFYPQATLFIDADTAWIVGLGGEILHTSDGGNSWAIQQSDTIAPLFGIGRLGSELYVVGGEGVLLKLQNDHWVRLDHGKPIRSYLRAALPLGSDKLLVAGQAGTLYVLSINNL